MISQNYTLALRELHQTYASDRLQFIGLFPNTSSEPEQIKVFKENYEIPFALETDYCHAKMEALGATITPEVVIYNESQGETLYKGRIDNTYFRVGKRRQVTTTSELKDALESIVNQEPIAVSETQAIGCFISPNKIASSNCQ